MPVCNKTESFPKQIALTYFPSCSVYRYSYEMVPKSKKIIYKRANSEMSFSVCGSKHYLEIWTFERHVSLRSIFNSPIVTKEREHLGDFQPTRIISARFQPNLRTKCERFNHVNKFGCALACVFPRLCFF